MGCYVIKATTYSTLSRAHIPSFESTHLSLTLWSANAYYLEKSRCLTSSKVFNPLPNDKILDQS